MTAGIGYRIVSIGVSVLALACAGAGSPDRRTDVPRSAFPSGAEGTVAPQTTGGPDGCDHVAGSRDWTTERSYPRGFVPRGDGIQLGLGGRPSAAVRATVKAPGGSEQSTTKTQEQHRGATAQYVARYPADFTPAGTAGVLGVTTPGAYTVLWEADGALAACDRFEVTATGVADARSCAPAGWSAIAPGGTLVLRSGTATMSIAGDQQLLGIVGDPWYAFEPNDKQGVTFSDGSITTLIVDRASPPRRVAAQFAAGPVPYRFDASAEGLPDLVARSRDVILCARERMAAAGPVASPPSQAHDRVYPTRP